MIELEEAVMEIIVNAGQSRSLCFEALQATLIKPKVYYRKLMALPVRRTICKPS